ncbi:protein-L-isoaspartate O-methyltransferase family protein [Pseudorhodoferax sp.]|jgi:protein-L-isoaspartate(D-aspartate) O-methyltransferase|uniref:protein-L-isoaspartate O-methyltransferase family protein n=1 Tax=Pseudorhodoferax sp. TaxID=1993553 RepID=UPI001B69AA92|nr:protein-L-isoaspartate O-methyltransferase [Pseudorhodoferax sp.]MBP8145182.1 protein-L-isoaspartate O-methyltransferase [Inhella sp.]
MDFEQARFNMIEQQIRPWQVLDPAVLQLLSLVRREDFVPAALRHLALGDTELPLAAGRRMLAPRVEARLLQDAQIQPHERVLELGTGNGYLTALLCHQAAEVVSVDPDAALLDAVRANLRRLGLTRCDLVQGDPARGCPSKAPFDVIVLTGSLHEVPAALLAQLRPQGRLLAIVGDEPVMQAVRIQGGARTELFDTVAARLPGATEPSPFVF